MRFLHLSDLHLGRRLHEASLIDEQRLMLSQILAIIDAEKLDGVLIAGDVYDKSVPSAEAVSLLDDFLTELSKREQPVFLISGNHDSAERLAFGGRLFAASRLYFSPVYDREHARIEPIRLTDTFGELCVWLLPFVKPAHVRSAFPDAEISTYTDALRTVIDSLPINPSARNVLLCHQFITGGARSESEEVSVGGLDQVDCAVLAPFDYVALGHLHHAQSVGRETVRYCGTPYKYSFSEVNDEKSVTLVTLAEKGDVRIETRALTPQRDLRELRGTYAELTLRENYVNTRVDDYLRITLTDENDVPDALARLQVVYPHLLELKYDNRRTKAQSRLEQSVERRSPIDLLGDFYALCNNQPLNDEQRAYALAFFERGEEGRA